jgi:hypothetical protein
VTVDSPARRARLEALGVVVLTTDDRGQTTDDGSSSPVAGRSSVVVLADADQLEALARLRFEPAGSDDLAALTAAAGPEKAWLAASLRPLLARAAAADPSGLGKPEGSTQSAEALASLRAAMHALTREQMAGIAASISPDDDGDGLTNTEEAWWCTDPQNPNSDGDAQGYKDGQEVDALLDFTLPRSVRWGYGPPFGPPNAWPNFNDRNGTHVSVCNDGDYDTIPDYAEAYMVGTSVPDENTDGDKFDDGQELFGRTFCPGGDTTGGYGIYPRTQDVSFITCIMPSWIRPPGDSPFVAAYPVIDFLVDPATIEVMTKEIRTIERTITQGEEISTGFAETEGNSTTVGTVDTNTRNTWQENSTTEGGIEPARVATSSGLLDVSSTTSAHVSIPGTKSVTVAKHSDERMAPSAPTPLITPTIALDSAIPQATKHALDGARTALPRSQYYAITGLDVIGDWQFISVAGLVGVSNPDHWDALENGNWYGLVLVHTDPDGEISAAAEGTAEFTELLAQVPDTILPKSSKIALDPLSNPDRCSISDGYQCSISYRFPWELNRQWEFGARSVHQAGYASLNGTPEWAAVDVGVLGFNAPKPASNTVYAAYDGVVGWKCDIADSISHAYRIGNFIYAHLVPEVTLTITQAFKSGETIGQLRKGNFRCSDETKVCGFACQEPEQFHLHWGFPNSGSLQVSGWSLKWDTTLNDTCWGGSCDKDATWTRTGSSVTTGGHLSAEYFDDSDQLVCSVSSLQSSQVPPPTSLNLWSKISGFFERLGQSVHSFVGKPVRTCLLPTSFRATIYGSSVRW